MQELKSAKVGNYSGGSWDGAIMMTNGSNKKNFHSINSEIQCNPMQKTDFIWKAKDLMETLQNVGKTSVS